jgi:aminodeoxyfutalosine deaminase
LIVHHAGWVLAIAGPPIRNGWIAIDHRRIAAVGADAARPATARVARVPFGHDPFVILPALVNAHTHLELSWMRGRVAPGDRFDHWIQGLIALRRREGKTHAATDSNVIREAVREARASGTSVFGDISNTLVTVELLREIDVAAHVFLELIGFSTPNPDEQLRESLEHVKAAHAVAGHPHVTLAPHAPYTVSPALFKGIRKYLDDNPDAISSVHLGESRDEVEFLKHGTGPIRHALEALGAWNVEWKPVACSPLEYIDRVGLLDRRVLIVHGVQLTDAELGQVKAAGATIVTCPRSNRWTGAGTPPLSRFYASGVRVAIGTDSLASVDDLNMFNELATVRALAPDVSARRIIESATRIGAEALGFSREFGTIEPGKRAELIAVRIPRDVPDVEEYLLTGIKPADIAWLDTGEP